MWIFILLSEKSAAWRKLNLGRKITNVNRLELSSQLQAVGPCW